MPYSRAKCKRCDQPPPPGSTISARGLCRPCGESAVIQNIISMTERSGPRYYRWLDGMARTIRPALEQAADRVRVP